MAPSPYESMGGALKLKGAAAGPAKKKKKKKSSTSEAVKDQERGSSSSKALEREGSGSGLEVERRSESPMVGSPSGGGKPADGRTDAQRRFDEVQRKRLLDKATKAASKTHKDRVAEFNTKLENMSEHYDIPRVGPG